MVSKHKLNFTNESFKIVENWIVQKKDFKIFQAGRHHYCLLRNKKVKKQEEPQFFKVVYQREDQGQYRNILLRKNVRGNC